jgi:hypothetical protein
LIPFSTGTILSGATVVSAAPILMGFGSSAVEIIDGFGQSIMPPNNGGFSVSIPIDGTLSNLQISADLLVASVASINTTPLIYEFTVFVAASTPNDGTAHISTPYTTTLLSDSLTFGGESTPVTPGNFYTATKLNVPGSLLVSAGDRIGIRVRTFVGSDPSAADITQLSFSASLRYSLP